MNQRFSNSRYCQPAPSEQQDRAPSMLRRHESKDTKASRPANTGFMTGKQVGQQPFANHASLRSSFLKFSHSSGPMSAKSNCSHDTFTVDFLKNLRNNRPARPGGARPLPKGNGQSTLDFRHALPPRADSALDGRVEEAAEHEDVRPSTSAGHHHAQFTLQDRDTAGRPLAGQDLHQVKLRDFSGSTGISDTRGEISSSFDGLKSGPKIPYYERGQRWMERQESKSLSAALNEMDIKESARVHGVAQEEAADLVWKHQNPGVPYTNPDANFKQHLRKGSHARSQSIGPFGATYVRKGGTIPGSRSSSGGSTSTSRSRVISSGSHVSKESSSNSSYEIDRQDVGEADSNSKANPNKVKAYGSLRFSIPRPSSLSRRFSSEKNVRTISGQSEKSLFRNPNDHIYEEPEEDFEIKAPHDEEEPRVLRNTPRNTSYTLRSTRNKLGYTQNNPKEVVSLVDIHKNPPSQLRNALYTKNRNTKTPKSGNESPERSRKSDTSEDLEIRSEDIRNATSMRLKDRSPKLPMPWIISDSPGRPIVSFDRDFKPREVEVKHETSTASLRPNEGSKTDFNGPRKPAMLPSNSEPCIPRINITSAPVTQVNNNPSTSFHGASSTTELRILEDVSKVSAYPVPSIQLPDTGPARSLPKPCPGSFPQPANRPLPHHSSTAPVKSSPHWSPAHQSINRGQAQCAACALPIAGKIVSAASKRFHPGCFSCYNCGELLECVAFYPEPETFRAERLARIHARMDGHPIPPNQRQHSEEDDGDSSLRFYCHLDFHEKFSPRCRSCKTPIEGEVVLACGGEWHVGHFFCAECGDPFDQATPFIGKDGFAWCVGCHTMRFSGKCAGCRKPIVDTVIKALDREWHEDCFCCKECGGGFEDGRFFTREDDNNPVCVKCEARRLKA